MGVWGLALAPQRLSTPTATLSVPGGGSKARASFLRKTRRADCGKGCAQLKPHAQDHGWPWLPEKQARPKAKDPEHSSKTPAQTPAQTPTQTVQSGVSSLCSRHPCPAKALRRGAGLGRTIFGRGTAPATQPTNPGAVRHGLKHPHRNRSQRPRFGSRCQALAGRRDAG